MRIVHLSDFHITQEGLNDLDNLVMPALLKDLRRLHAQKKVDLVVFSGDLIDKAGHSFEDMESAFFNFTFKVIDPIISELELTHHRFFFIPGNHDINRNADSEISQVGMEQHLVNTETVNRYIDSNEIEGRKRILPFKDFEKQYYHNFQGEHELSNFQSVFCIEVDGLKIGITCFNSAWRCYSDSDKNKIILGERQIINARRLINDCDIKIALVHHQLDWFSDFERKTIESMITRDYDMLFSGHVHEGSSWSLTTMHGSLFYSVAPCNWTLNLRTDSRTTSNGYSVVDYYKDERKIVVKHRRYSYHKEDYDPNTDLGDSDGVSEYYLPQHEELIKKKHEWEVAERIKSVHIPDINSHLLTFNTESSAPKEIEDMFVLPRIINNVQYDTDSDDEEIPYDLTSLCSNEQNLLIIGSKESGKTILLDKILIELTNNIKEYSRVPVFINFNDMKNTRIETMISRYLGIGIMEIKKFIADHQLVLLIDDISFSESKKHSLKILESFLLEQPSIKVIASTTGSLEGEVPLHIFEYAILSTFKQLQLKEFKTKEIKMLIKKWFSGNEDYDSEKLDKIVAVFSTLNIPRTPLAVSMFLWIIEQQENYKPINNATMLENFIERLFKKQLKREIYSERFDYRNKERLLSEVAKRMFDANQINYRLTYNELRNFVYEYLRVRKFDFQEEEVVREFINNGILLTEYELNEVYIRFRFTCFFKYFLMKCMNFDQEFKEYVLSEEQYLLFEDEIEYYTGLHRDESEILELVVSRMNNSYEDLLSRINQLEDTFDTLFETVQSISSTLEVNEVKNLVARNKPTDEELESLNDSMLDNMPIEKGISKKESELNLFDQLFRSWSLAAKVLKNTEETQVEDLKSHSYKSILNCSMAFASLYKLLISNFLKGNDSDEEEDQNKEKYLILKRFMPLIHQSVTFSLLGTGKLRVVIREHIENTIKDESVSDLEKFISVFLYADLKEKDYPRYISELVRNISHSYMNDMILFKVVSYYYLRSKSKESDLYFENIIGDIITRSKGLNKKLKYEVIEKFRDKKRAKIRERNDISLDA